MSTLCSRSTNTGNVFQNLRILLVVCDVTWYPRDRAAAKVFTRHDDQVFDIEWNHYSRSRSEY